MVDHAQAGVHGVDRHDQKLGAHGARGLEQVEARGVPVEQSKSKAPQRLDAVGIVVEHDGLHARRKQEAPDDLSKATEARDDDRRAFVFDRIGFALCAIALRQRAVVHEREQRRQRHRQRDRQREHGVPVSGQEARLPRDTEHHERELAALREQDRE